METVAELSAEWFRGVETLGVVSGASTPNSIIEEILIRLEEMGGA
ncbi:MAG TPA: hypothetical protein VNA86_14555 [bacterium]|nr:hypothetical protein [bacterium]